ncbi:MAG: hypothetical protein IIA72_03245 [Proteobacteria bacterium]|nr:hypothetical protein [Pseudomonadota bacterium]
MPQSQKLYAQVASGDTVSEDIALIGARLVGLFVPTVDSCQLFMQGNYSPRSGSGQYGRVLNPAGSGDFTVEVTVGSLAIALTDPLAPFPRARIELSAAQTDTRTFALAVKVN